MAPANFSRAGAWGLLLIVLLATCKSGNDTSGGDTRTLTVTLSGNGSGTVTGPRDLTCPGKCSVDYDFESDITLTENPAAGSIFGGWTGDCSSGGTDSLTTFSIDDDPSCDARFDLLGGVATLTITIEAAGISTGRVIADGIDCGDDGVVINRSVRGIDCSQDYPLNTTVNLKAGFGGGSYFKGWLDDCAGFTTAADIDLAMTGNKSCKAQFDVSNSGGIEPKGGASFDYRAETMVLLENKAIVAGYDAPKGDIFDLSNIQVITSPAGPEFSPCSGPRGIVTFRSRRAQYNADVVFATCTDSRQGSTTLATGGFTEIQPLGFAPGKAAHYTDNWVPIADFEFGEVRVTDQSDDHRPTTRIPLTPGERSCPFDLTLHGEYAYVTGREGVAGTATENCNNWSGIWKVNLTLGSVTGFTRFGKKIRDVEYGGDDKLYASDFDLDKVYVLDAATMALLDSLSVGDGPTGLDLNPAASRMLLTNWNSNKIQLWDLTNRMLIDEKDSGGIHPVEVKWKGDIGLVLNFGDAGANIGGSLRAFQITF